jgi:hypothetical protein
MWRPLLLGHLRHAEPNAIDYAKFYSRSRDAVIRVYGDAGNVIGSTSARASLLTSKNIGRSRGMDTKPVIARRPKGGSPEISSPKSADAKILHLKFVADD